MLQYVATCKTPSEFIAVCAGVRFCVCVYVCQESIVLTTRSKRKGRQQRPGTVLVTTGIKKGAAVSLLGTRPQRCVLFVAGAKKGPAQLKKVQ